MELQDFMGRFRFDPAKAYMVGVEREGFLVGTDGTIVPYAPKALQHIYENGWDADPFQSRGVAADVQQLVGYELSACQIETRTRPRHMHEIWDELYWQDSALRKSLNELRLGLSYSEVAPENMPLDVYPDPTGRYARITKDMPRSVLQAACRVIGTHVHVGMPDAETALRVYNRVIAETQSLCALGDNSSGKRLEIYRLMAPDSNPPEYATWKEFFDTALEKGFVEDPRKCWTLIRISIHGTLEFRMFGATESVDKVVGWVRRCHALCCNA